MDSPRLNELFQAWVNSHYIRNAVYSALCNSSFFFVYYYCEIIPSHSQACGMVVGNKAWLESPGIDFIQNGEKNIKHSVQRSFACGNALLIKEGWFQAHSKATVSNSNSLQMRWVEKHLSTCNILNLEADELQHAEEHIGFHFCQPRTGIDSGRRYSDIGQ